MKNRRLQSKQLFIELTLIAQLIIAPPLHAQRPSDMASITRVPVMARITGSAASSDPDARRLCIQAIEAMGGTARWQQIHSAELKLTGSTNISHPFLLGEDWSEGSPQHLRGVIGANRDATRPHGNNITQHPGAIPGPDESRSLVEHLPAAALHLLLGKQEYKIRQGSSAECGLQPNCVEVYRKQSSGDLYLREQIWIFDPTTKLPKVAAMLQTSVGVPIWKHIQYASFQASGDVLIPAVITTSTGYTLPQTINIQVVTLGQSLNKAQFDQELSQQ